MAAFTRLSYWILGKKDKETPAPALNSSSDFLSGFREHDCLKFPAVNGARMRSSSRRVRGKRQNRHERIVDKEYDMVIVPSDGVCMSGSESDDSDYSIGWEEPHSAEFLSEGESESSFAVLVRCYDFRSEEKELAKSNVLGAAGIEFHNGFSNEDKSYIEHWLSSLHNM